jgi:hypothetical protein
LKRCKNCKEKFTPIRSTLEKYCRAIDCKTAEALENLAKLKKAQEKKAKANLKERKDELKTLPQLKNDLQKLVNEYVRLRDRGLNCISCGMSLAGRKVNASHYLAVGNYPAVRYDLRNINNSCIECNKFKGGNIVEYRIKLIEKIGLAEVEDLEAIRNTPRRYTKPEILELIAEFKIKIKNFSNLKPL